MEINTLLPQCAELAFLFLPSFLLSSFFLPSISFLSSFLPFLPSSFDSSPFLHSYFSFFLSSSLPPFLLFSYSHQFFFFICVCVTVHVGTKDQLWVSFLRSCSPEDHISEIVSLAGILGSLTRLGRWSVNSRNPSVYTSPLQALNTMPSLLHCCCFLSPSCVCGMVFVCIHVHVGVRAVCANLIILTRSLTGPGCR